MWINFHTHNAFTGADKKFRISRISLFYFAPAAFADIDKKCVINNSAVLTVQFSEKQCSTMQVSLVKQ